MSTKAVQTPSICPVCGWPVPPSARACPGCGSDESTGWSRAPEAEYAHVLPAEPVPRPRRRTRYAFAVIVSVAVTTLLASLGVLQGIWIIAGLALIVLVACAPLAFGRADPDPGDESFEVLLARCRHDRALAQRLVDGESRRYPDQTRADWISHAITRLANDRR